MYLKESLAKRSSLFLAIYASIFLFITYTCTYALRKPFTAALYEGDYLWGFDAKLLYVMAQIIGYACSKFIGVRILPGMKKNQRALYSIGLMSFSEIMLIGFGYFSLALKVVCIFLSGIPLGMIWGILFSYIEGRRISEILNVGVSVTLIISSGIVKSIGQFVLDTFHVTEYWMPAITGALCYPIMILSVLFLNQIPEPNEIDKIQRTERQPMSKAECIDFLRKFFSGIVLLVIFYSALTIFRELRDSFAADIWKELDVKGAMIFTQTEIPITIVVLGLMLMLYFIKSNRWAVNSIYIMSMIGGGLMIISTILFTLHILSPIWWMVISGLGMYLGYIPFSFLIDRLIASLKIISTMVFLLYLADSFGYLGTAIVFIIKNFSEITISWTNMLIYMAYISGGIAMISIYFIFRYFRRQIVQVVNKEKLEIKEND